MLQKLLGAVGGIAVAGMATAAQGVTIVNGSFELGVNIPPLGSTFYTLDINSAGGVSDPGNITGWTVVEGPVAGVGQIDWVRTPLAPSHAAWPASDGSLSLDLNGANPGAIQQTITGLEVGAVYRISFDMSGNGKSGDIVKDLIATVITDHTFSFDTSECCGGPPAIDFTDMLWVTYSFLFTATGTSEILKFTSLETGAYGPTLDNVRISAVPLPAALSLFASALGGMGLLAWRRKRKAAA